MSGHEARKEVEMDSLAPFLHQCGEQLFCSRGQLSSLCTGELSWRPARRPLCGGQRLEDTLALVSRRVDRTSRNIAEKG